MKKRSFNQKGQKNTDLSSAQPTEAENTLDLPLPDGLDDMPIVQGTDNPGEFADEIINPEETDVDESLIEAAFMSEEDFAALEAGMNTTSEENPGLLQDQDTEPTLDDSESTDTIDSIHAVDSIEISGENTQASLSSQSGMFEEDENQDQLEHNELNNTPAEDQNDENLEHDESISAQDNPHEEDYGYTDLVIDQDDKIVTEDGEIVDQERNDHVAFANEQTHNDHGDPIEFPVSQAAAAAARSAASVDDDDSRGFVQKKVDAIKKDPIVLGAIAIALVGAGWWFTMGRNSAPSAPVQQESQQIEMVEVQPTDPQQNTGDEGDPSMQDNGVDVVADVPADTVPVDQTDPSMAAQGDAPMAIPPASQGVANPVPVSTPPEMNATAGADQASNETFTATQMKALEQAIVADFKNTIAEKDALIAKLQSQVGGGASNPVDSAKLRATQGELNKFKKLYESERKASAQVRAYSEQLYRELVIAANGGQSEVMAKIKSGELTAPRVDSAKAGSSVSSSSVSSSSSSSTSKPGSPAQRSIDLAKSNPGSIAVKAITPTVAVLNVNGQDLYVRVGSTANGITVKSINTTENTVSTNIGELRF